MDGLLNTDPNQQRGRIPEIIKGSGINPETGIIDRTNVEIVLAQLIVVASEAQGVVDTLEDQGDEVSDEYRTSVKISKFLEYYASDSEDSSLGYQAVLTEIQELKEALASTRKFN